MLISNQALISCLGLCILLICKGERRRLMAAEGANFRLMGH